MPARRDLVINTGPLLALAAADYLDVLRELFAKIDGVSLRRLLGVQFYIYDGDDEDRGKSDLP
jgi:hypothetical protein